MIKVNGMKNVIMQVAYFLKGSMINLLCIGREWLLKRNLATIIPLKLKVCGKFHRFNANAGSIKMLKKIAKK